MIKIAGNVVCYYLVLKNKLLINQFVAFLIWVFVETSFVLTPCLPQHLSTGLNFHSSLIVYLTYLYPYLTYTSFYSYFQISDLLSLTLLPDLTSALPNLLSLFYV